MDLPVEVQQRSAQLVTQDSLVNYIMEFQSFAGLPQTGDLDDETVRMMNKPRCGVKDIVGKSASMRKKRYALQVCWFSFPVTDISCFNNSPGLSVESEEPHLQDLSVSERQQDVS